MNFLNDRARELITQMVIANFSKIKVAPGICRYNFRCYNNAVHDALMKKEDELAMCIYMHGSWPIIHFINVNSDGFYIDNTLGQWSSQYEYYFIRFINKDSFFDIYDIFTNYRKELRKSLPWYVRLFSNYDF